MQEKLKALAVELKSFEKDMEDKQNFEDVIQRIGKLLEETIAESIQTDYFFLDICEINGKMKVVCELDGYFNMYKIIRNQIYAQQLNADQETVHFVPFLTIDRGYSYFSEIDKILEPYDFNAGHIRFRLDQDDNLEVNIPGFDLHKLESNLRSLLLDRILVTKYSELDKIRKLNKVSLTSNQDGEYIDLNEFEAHFDYTFEKFFSRVMIGNLDPEKKSKLQFRQGVMTVASSNLNGYAPLLLESIEKEDVPPGIEFYSLRFGLGNNEDGCEAKNHVRNLIGNKLDNAAFEIAAATGNFFYLDFEVIDTQAFTDIIKDIVVSNPELGIELYNGLTGQKVIFNINKLAVKKLVLSLFGRR